MRAELAAEHTAHQLTMSEDIRGNRLDFESYDCVLQTFVTKYFDNDNKEKEI